MRIYTDASTKNSLSGIAFVATTNDDQEIYKEGKVIRQSDNNTAELTAILFALDNIKKINSDKHITILTDSEYAINAIRNNHYRKEEKELMQDIFTKMSKYRISIFWVKGHQQVGTVLAHFNNRADKMSKVVRVLYEKQLKQEKKNKALLMKKQKEYE